MSIYGDVQVLEGRVIRISTGVGITEPTDRAIYEAAAKYVYGDVLHIGIENGWARAKLAEALGIVETVRTIDSDEDLTDAWAGEVAAENEHFAASAVDGDHELAIVASLRTEVEGYDPGDFDSMLVTLPTGFFSSMNDKIIPLFPTAGGRVVVVEYDVDEISHFPSLGWAMYEAEGPGPGGARVLILDRFDLGGHPPIGTARTDIYVPGRGWVAPGSLVRQDGS